MHWTSPGHSAKLAFMIELLERAERFRALHQRPEPLLLPNPWDAGSARLLAHLGFEALATTSLGVANMHGQKRASAEAILENVRAISAATDLPVSADLENGYADDPGEAAAMVARACECGAVGASIEDYTGDPSRPLYDFAHAVERVQAAVEVARRLPVPFVFTARAEGRLRSRAPLEETIARLQAFEKAGADVLYAPALRNIAEMRAVIEAVQRPVNVVMGLAEPSITLEQLREAGVRRVSIGGAFSRVALRAMLDAAREMKAGRFTFAANMASVDELYAAF